ncbi:alpha/beta hydrolase [Caenimonas sedimenti]|uniref:Alpha/beta hydrolase n=1 Tax=Caenimonas sedimenti TaxID=2596921 RepID=A0A562ZHW7_9BURK|nr:alpha/beta hydrolase [Caenimonas sedimenti]TWO68103.1 alpha/beta hydrolase [Caenimonas sedimenti]
MLHPQAQALLRLLQEKGVAPAHVLTPEENRRLYRERAGYTQPPPPVVALSQDLAIPGTGGPIPARLIRPPGSGNDERLPVLVFFHGGGWVIGDLDTHDTLCRELANGAGCAVLSVDYRLAPEHRFPAAAEDAIAALGWVASNAAALSLDASRMAVGGDSAGGNLAAVAALAARDSGGPQLRFQLLIYPVTDLRRGSDSYRARATGYTLGADSMAYFCTHYLGEGEAGLVTDWRASPLLHPDLSRLPPALVLVAEYDPLHDEGVQYAHALSAAGSPATLVNFARQMHGFILMGAVIDEANTAVQLCAAQLRQALR